MFSRSHRAYQSSDAMSWEGGKCSVAPWMVSYLNFTVLPPVVPTPGPRMFLYSSILIVNRCLEKEKKTGVTELYLELAVFSSNVCCVVPALFFIFSHVCGCGLCLLLLPCSVCLCYVSSWHFYVCACWSASVHLWATKLQRRGCVCLSACNYTHK